MTGAITPLLPWNPDAAVEPGRQAVVETGLTGGRVRLFVAKAFSPEAVGGFLTADSAESLGFRLIELARLAKEAERTNPTGG